MITTAIAIVHMIHTAHVPPPPFLPAQLRSEMVVETR
jgi:hypothetical protein